MNDANAALAATDLAGHTIDHRVAVASLIETYKPIMIPRARWAAIAEFTRSAATDFNPRHQAEARNVLFGIARIADWTHHAAGHPLRRDIVLNPRNIDDFIRRGYPVAEAQRKTVVRNYLHLLSSELGLGDEARKRARTKQTVTHYGPYSPREYTDFRLTGRTLSTDHRQHIWSAALALGAGFALSTPEIFNVRPEDIREDSRGLIVNATGPSARAVVCLPEWERDVTAAVARRNENLYLVADEHPSDPSTWLHKTLQRSANTSHQERYIVERLRTTWIVRHLEARTPVQVIMSALGATTTRPIDRCLQYVPNVDETEYFAALQLGGDR